MEPMFLDDPLSWAIRLGLGAIVVAGVVLGLLWMRQLMSVESEAHVFASTATGGRRWPAYAIGAGVVLLLAVAAFLSTFTLT